MSKKYVPVKGSKSQVISVDTDVLNKISSTLGSITLKKSASNFSAEKYTLDYIESLFKALETSAEAVSKLSSTVSMYKERVDSIPEP